jgi:hypothetical protein
MRQNCSQLLMKELGFLIDPRADGNSITPLGSYTSSVNINDQRE